MKLLIIRIMTVMLCAVMLFSFSACNSGKVPETPDEQTDNQNDDENNPEKPDPDPEKPDPKPEDPRKEVTMEELIKEMSKNEFTSNIRTNSFVGLTDPSVVGIDREKMNDILYPVPDDSEFKKIINVADYGITPGKEDNIKRFSMLVNDLQRADGLKKVYFPEGDYKFSQTVIINNINDVYFCSENEDSRFTFLITNWLRGLEITDCNNIHFNNCNLDYLNPSAVTGRVVGCDMRKSTVTIKVDEGYDLTLPEYDGGKVNKGSYVEYILDRSTGKYIPNPDGNLLFNPTAASSPVPPALQDGKYDEKSRELTITFLKGKLKPVKNDTRVNVAYTMHQYMGFKINGGSEFYMENVNIYHAAGMAINISDVHNISLNRLKISPKENTERLMTATADGFHSCNCTGKILITNSILEASHDDSMNIKSWYGKVVASQPKKIIYDKNSKSLVADVGDVIEIYDPFDFKLIGEFTVKEVNTLEGYYTIKETLKVDAADFIYCIPNKSPSLTVKNCFIGNKRNRGMLVQCRNIEISNCTFSNIVHDAVQIFSVINRFKEGIMPRHAVIRNNKFMNNSLGNVGVFVWGPKGDTAQGTLKDVEISNNFFADGGNLKSTVVLRGAGDSKLKNNLFVNPFRSVPNNTDDYAAVQLKKSENIEIKDNCVIDDNMKQGFKFIYDDNTSKDIKAENNIIIR